MKWSESLSVVSDSLRPHGLSRPKSWMGSLSLLQGIFPAQGSNPGPLHCRWILYQLSHKGSSTHTKGSVNNKYCYYDFVEEFTEIWGFPGGSEVKSVCLQCRRPGFNPWVEKIPWRRKWQPIPVFLPGESHGWRSLVGYSPWGHKESDMAEPLSFYRDMNILRARNQCHLSQFLWKYKCPFSIPVPCLTDLSSSLCRCTQPRERDSFCQYHMSARSWWWA